jgi:hypothetical protein
MNKFAWPIIVVDRNGADLFIYASHEELEKDLEAIDIKRNEYIAFDSEGRLLTLGIQQKRIPVLFRLFKSTTDVVVVQDIEEVPSAVNTLRDALIRFLIESGNRSELLDKMGITDLLHKINKMQGKKIKEKRTILK